MNLNNTKALSIQIQLSGLSFCILDPASKKVEVLKQLPFNKKETPEYLLEQLKLFFNNNSEFSPPFYSVLVIYQNELAALVPQSLFDDNYLSDYLKFNSKILNTDYLAFDALEINNSINVYVPYVNINNFIFDAFGEFVYKHAATIFINAILQKERHSEQTSIYINVEANHFELAVTQHGKLLLYNSFTYYSKEDVIYFVLFTIEQLNIKPESMHVKLSGFITKNDELYTLLNNYVYNLDFDTPLSQFSLGSFNKSISIHNHLLLLNSFL